MTIDYTEEPERFWERVDRSGGEASCWPWLRCRTPAGYGQLRWKWRAYYAHRFAWFLTFGRWPESETLDHACRNRACVNPRHLREVTLSENLLLGESPPARNARKLHCPSGHALVGDNVIHHGPGLRWRRCRACANARFRARYAARRGRAA